jgi:osmotically-inducible protein OsmY
MKTLSRSRGILGIAALVGVVALVASCSTTQPVSRQVDDSQIHAAVKAKLTADRFSNIVNVDINVTNGIVTLAGEVPNAKVKTEAGDEARSVDGVVRVNNNLQVKNPPVS